MSKSFVTSSVMVIAKFYPKCHDDINDSGSLGNYNWLSQIYNSNPAKIIFREELLN